MPETPKVANFYDRLKSFNGLRRVVEVDSGYLGRRPYLQLESYTN